MVAPTVILWLCAGVSGAASLELGAGADASPLLRIAFAVAISFWVTVDARQRRRDVPYDYDSLMFFAWPILGPVYLWQTRRWRAGITLLWFILLLSVASIGELLLAVRM
jgi:hypothetical protein